MIKKRPLIIFLSFLSQGAVSQPFADILNFNYQTFSSRYSDSTFRKNTTDNYFLNFFLPKEFKSGHTLLVRLNTEMLCSTIGPDSAYTRKLYSVSLPFGIKFLSKNRKWETIVIAVPKVASDMRDAIDGHDWQYGGIFLEQFVKSPTFKAKLGFYYNREAFGNFIVPWVGVDWKVNKRLSMYGILPTNYKVELNLIKDKLYAGLNLKFFTRSFRLSKWDNYDYVRYNEGQVKLFVDWFVAPKVILFAEVGYSLSENPLQHRYNTNDRKTENISWDNPVFTPVKDYPVFGVGLAYRVRFDLEKQELPAETK